MIVTVTSKVKLNTDDVTAKLFRQTAEAYTKACNEMSEYAFSNNLMTSREDLHKAKYRDARQDCGLKSQMACSVSRTVVAKYKAIKEQLKQNPFVMKEGKKTYRFKRNLDWLTSPVVFHKPFVELVRGRDYNLCQEGFSINTLNKRVKVSFKSYDLQERLDDGWKMGSAILRCKKGTWFLHVSFSKEFDDVNEYNAVVGADRGLRFPIVSYNGVKTDFYAGSEIAEKREKFARTRASLQAKGTKGSKRVLNRISGRENRWMDNENHCFSKALVEKCDRGTLIVLEELSDVSTNENNLHGKKQSRQLRSWAFYDLEQKIIYKAHMKGCEVIKVPPKYTSQRCPKCGHIHKNNRNRATHEFRCKKCGYRSNDDRVAAMNIRELGQRYLKTGELKGFPKR